MTGTEEKRIDQPRRLAQIVDVLRRNEIVKGLTPEKLCTILEELGPTYIKLGQVFSLRTDFLPAEYCEALARLRTSVKPMPAEQVRSILERAYGRPVDEVFADFCSDVLGSASIAQVHLAVLSTGEKVVVKVQREGIHEIMNRDIQLLKHAAELVKYTPAKGLVDFNQVLDQLWVVTQQEMNFLLEADNLERFARLNHDVAYVEAPRVFRQYTTAQVLVMEYVDGIQIDHMEELTAAGYDLGEIAAKLADNYIKQVTEDGFFHADPHPGNLRILNGKIVYLDMGMMGSLNEGIRKTLLKAVGSIARGDAEGCTEAVLALGEFRGEVDRRRLYRDCESMLTRYGTTDLAEINLSQALADVMEIMKANQITMPSDLSILARGVGTLEGVVMGLAPETNVMQIASARVGQDFFQSLDVKEELNRGSRAVYESARKSLDIPALLADLLRSGIKGDSTLNVEHHPDRRMEELWKSGITRLCAGLISAAMAIGFALGGGTPVLGEWSSTQLLCLILTVVLGLIALVPGKRNKGSGP